jgi:hypothetical protein
MSVLPHPTNPARRAGASAARSEAEFYLQQIHILQAITIN